MRSMQQRSLQHGNALRPPWPGRARSVGKPPRTVVHGSSRVVQVLDNLTRVSKKEQSEIVRLVADLEHEAAEAARKEADTEAEAARKEAEAARKEAEAARKEAEYKVLLAQKEVQYQQLEHQRQTVTTELLLLRGLLHARGVIEYAEDHFFRPYLWTGYSVPQRWQKWEQILTSKPKLLTCTNSYFKHGVSTRQMANKVVSIYDLLSGHIHQGSRTAVDIKEGPLTREQMGVVCCITKAVGVEPNMIYRDDPISSSGDESEGGKDDSDLSPSSE